MFCGANGGKQGDVIKQLRNLVTKTSKNKIVSTSSSNPSNTTRDGIAVAIAVNVDTLHNRPSNTDKYDDFYEFITDEIMLYGQKNLIQKVKIKEGEYKVPWTIDSEATSCMRCNLYFGMLFNRKHHCRLCGFVVCTDCSSTKLALKFLYEDGGSRVCKVCYDNQASSILPPQSLSPITSVVIDNQPVMKCTLPAAAEINKYELLNQLDNQTLAAMIPSHSMTHAKQQASSGYAAVAEQTKVKNELAQKVIDQMDTLNHTLMKQHSSLLTNPSPSPPLLKGQNLMADGDFDVTPTTRRHMIESIMQNNGVWEVDSDSSISPAPTINTTSKKNVTFSKSYENSHPNLMSHSSLAGSTSKSTPYLRDKTEKNNMNHVVWECSDSDSTPLSASPKGVGINRGTATKHITTNEKYKLTADFSYE